MLRKIYRKSIILYRKLFKKSFRVSLLVTDHCNLNCIGCSQFSPLAEPTFLDTEKYKKDMERLQELAGNRVNLVNLVGGEPLLHPELNEIICFARETFPKSTIRIATNGILLDKMNDTFWEVCRVNKVIIWLSPYPINLDIAKLKALATQYKVTFAQLDESKSVFKKYAIDISGKQDRKASFKKCSASICHTLHQGRLYVCPIIPVAKYFNKAFSQDLQVTDKDYIDIYQTNVRELLDFLKTPPPFCHYCIVDKRDASVQWGISKREMREWV